MDSGSNDNFSKIISMFATTKGLRLCTLDFADGEDMEEVMALKELRLLNSPT